MGLRPCIVKALGNIQLSIRVLVCISVFKIKKASLFLNKNIQILFIQINIFNEVNWYAGKYFKYYIVIPAFLNIL